jgi:hypothetical protein
MHRRLHFNHIRARPSRHYRGLDVMVEHPLLSREVGFTESQEAVS